MCYPAKHDQQVSHNTADVQTVTLGKVGHQQASVGTTHAFRC